MKYFKVLTRLSLPLFAFSVWANPPISKISGTITTTLTIFADSELVGDVMCAVPLTISGANPCISFGVDHIKLRLNGYTITGPVTPPTGCSLTTDARYGVGIEAIEQNRYRDRGSGNHPAL